MAQSWAEKFYSSPQWKRAREAYRRKVGGLCERCLQSGLYNPGEIVHHRVALTPENIDNPKVSLSFDNFMLLCRECHEAVHGAGQKRRYSIDEDGTVRTDAPHS